ncbi:MAG TPA: caspase family protein [Pricia sp.]|nr:caspase family protein [Pricia sp.]
MNAKATRPKLYALLVGIDQYRDPVTPLGGCVNDIKKIETYLVKQKDHFNPLIHTLTDTEATKTNLVAGFREHLSKARKKDTVLFYYSGHGTQEDADAVFWQGEADRKMEALVCYDSVIVENGTPRIHLLADKELRFLLHETARNQPHIVTIFDCCHSGGNTRNGNFDKVDKGRGDTVIKRRRLSMAFPKRDWQDFIFGDTISKTDIGEKGMTTVFPEGQHLQIAACQNDESAYEVNGEGVFTKNLIEILQRCHGNISYHRLQSTIQGYLRHQFKQTPKIYASGDPGGLFSCFLNKDAEQAPIEGSVSYNADMGWILDMGSIQGVVSGTELHLKEEPSGKRHKAKISIAHVTHSTVVFPEAAKTALEREAIFKAEITSFLTHALHLFIDPSAKDIATKAGLIAKLEAFENLNITGEIAKADYCVTIQNDTLILTSSAATGIPLVPGLPLNEFGKDQVSRILGYLDHLSRYTFVKHLTNPVSFLLRPDHISLTVYLEEDAKNPVPINADGLMLRYKKVESDWCGAIRIKLKNKSDKKLYCALCYLSFNFGVYTKMLPTGVVGLDPQAEIWTFDGDPIPFKLEPEVVKFGYSESTSFLKLIISTEDFTQQLNTLYLEDLPGPLSEDPKFKGFELAKKAETVHDWTTRLITVRMPNPEK